MVKIEHFVCMHPGMKIRSEISWITSLDFSSKIFMNPRVQTKRLIIFDDAQHGHKLRFHVMSTNG